jgi:RimJ/RimL family protein N-acetyltransferase
VISFPEGWTGAMQECPWCLTDIVVPEKPKEAARELRLDIRTKRLVFQRLNGNDRNDILEIVSDRDSLCYMDWKTMDGEEVEKWLAEDSRFRLLVPDTYVYFGVDLPKISKLIALVSFIYRGQELKQAGFEIVVNRAFHNQGYGAETVRGILAFAFEEANLRRVVAICDSRNVAGLKILDKAGMRREGEFIENRTIRDEWANTAYYAMLRREWQSTG